MKNDIPTVEIKEISNKNLFKVDKSLKPYHYINRLCEFIFSFHEDKRIIKIIQLYFGLNGHRQHTFTEIAERYSLTKVRISQIIKSSLKKINMVFINNDQFYTIRIHPEIIKETEKLYSKIKSLGDVLIENEVIEVIEEQYKVQFDKKYLNEFKFLLVLYEYSRVPSYLLGKHIKTNNTWILSDYINRNLLAKTFKFVRKLLRGKIIPLTISEIENILIEKKFQYNRKYIEYSLKISAETERVKKDKYQIKLEYLPSIADKAYRILYNKKVPMYVKSILKEINVLLLNSESDQKVKLYSLHNELIHDKRFIAVGGTGTYFLKEWNSISKATISELIVEYFIMTKKGSSFPPIFEYVKSKRPGAKRKSVITILLQDEKFIRTGSGFYELRL